jgi:hypothetical protein
VREKNGIIQSACEVRGDGQDLPPARGHWEEALSVLGLAIIPDRDCWPDVGFREEEAERSRMEAS